MVHNNDSSISDEQQRQTQDLRDMRERQAMVIAQLHEQGEQLSKAVDQLVNLLANANREQDSGVRQAAESPLEDDKS